jgi:hypothetical protein
VTRRKLIQGALAGACLSPACSLSDAGIVSRLRAICEAGDFAILGAGLVLNASNDLVPGAMTAGGEDCGQLELPDASSPPRLFSLAPDGAWAAWVPESSLPDAFGKGGRPEFCFMDSPKGSRSSSFKGWFGQQLAISSGAGHLAVVAVDRDLNRRLLAVKPATGDTEVDLTDLITGFSLGKVERLRFSASVRAWPSRRMTRSRWWIWPRARLYSKERAASLASLRQARTWPL